MEQQKSTFQKAFAHMYYLMLSADRIADPSELALGNKIIKYEGFAKTEVMEQIDQLSSVSRNQAIEDSISLLRSISKDDQLKCLAYVKLIAMSDGSFDESESNLLHNIGTNELNVLPQEIDELEKQLKQKISPEG
jgi:uncharacterized tellurite resistance protein B-like protein